MRFTSGQRRGENTGYSHVSFGTQYVGVVLIKYVNRSRLLGVDLTRAHILDFPHPFDNIIGFDVVLVVEMLNRPGFA